MTPGCPKKTNNGAVPQYCKLGKCKECCLAAQLGDKTKKCLQRHKPSPPPVVDAAATVAAVVLPATEEQQHA